MHYVEDFLRLNLLRQIRLRESDLNYWSLRIWVSRVEWLQAINKRALLNKELDEGCKFLSWFFRISFCLYNYRYIRLSDVKTKRRDPNVCQR